MGLFICPTIFQGPTINSYIGKHPITEILLFIYTRPPTGRFAPVEGRRCLDRRAVAVLDRRVVVVLDLRLVAVLDRRVVAVLDRRVVFVLDLQLEAVLGRQVMAVLERRVVVVPQKYIEPSVVRFSA